MSGKYREYRVIPCFTVLFTVLYRAFDALDRAFDALDRAFDALDRAFTAVLHS